MRNIRDIVGKAKQLFNKSCVNNPKFPETIILTDVVNRAIKFNVYSVIEKYRVAAYGGDRDALNYFLRVVRTDDIIYDIGASVGLFTVTASVVAARGVIYAFEPDPDTRRRLAENVSLNTFTNTKILNWAIGDNDDVAILYTDGASGYAPSLKLQERPGAPTGQVRVPMRSLDSVLIREELLQPDVIKIDVEGAEASCLNGSVKLLKGKFGRRPRVIFLEVHPKFLPDFNSSVDEIEQLLKSLGYKLQWSQNRDEQQHLCYIDQLG